MEWLTADLHLGHYNIIEYCGRPFKTIAKHDDGIIGRWNEVVSSGDTVWILGDFALWGPEKKSLFERTLHRLKGNKILVFGNHDKLQALDCIEVGFKMACTSHEFTDEGRSILAAHDPAWANAIPVKENWGMFCGHIHTVFRQLFKPHRILNVGVDQNNFYPMNFYEAIDRLFEEGEDVG